MFSLCKLHASGNPPFLPGCSIDCVIVYNPFVIFCIYVVSVVMHLCTSDFESSFCFLSLTEVFLFCLFLKIILLIFFVLFLHLISFISALTSSTSFIVAPDEHRFKNLSKEPAGDWDVVGKPGSQVELSTVKNSLAIIR